MHYEHWTEYGIASMETYVSGVSVEKMPVDRRTSGVTKNVRLCVLCAGEVGVVFQQTRFARCLLCRCCFRCW